MFKSFKISIAVLVSLSFVLSTSIPPIKRLGRLIDDPTPKSQTSKNVNTTTALYSFLKSKVKKVIAVCCRCFKTDAKSRCVSKEEPKEQTLNVKFESSQVKQKPFPISTPSIKCEENDSFGRSLSIANNNLDIDLKSFVSGNNVSSFVLSPVINYQKDNLSECSVYTLQNKEEYTLESLYCYISQQTVILETFYTDFKKQNKIEINKNNKITSEHISTIKFFEQRINEARLLASDILSMIEKEKEISDNSKHLELEYPEINKEENYKINKSVLEQKNYDYYLDSIKLKEKELRQHKLHIRSLVTIINKFKAKQENILMEQVGCNKVEDYLVVIVNLSSEVINLQREIDIIKKDLTLYKKNLESFRKEKTVNQYINNINVNLNLNGKKLSRFNRTKESIKTYSECRFGYNNNKYSNEKFSMKKEQTYNKRKIKTRCTNSAIIEGRNFE